MQTTSGIKNYLNYYNENNNNPKLTQKLVKEKEIRIARELIKEKISTSTNKTVDNTLVDDVLQRLIENNDLKKLNGSEFSKKITLAIKNIAAFGSIFQVYKDEPNFKRGEDVKNLVKFLYTNTDISSDIVSFKIIKALLIKKNKPLLHEVLKEFERVSQKILEDINSKSSIEPNKHMLTEILIGNLLAIVPFLEPDDGQLVTFPQFINNKWQSVSYQIERIQLTPNEMGDPMYAYGLSPIQNKEAPPLLLFMGTPPPTTTGVKKAEWVDLAPGYAVGEIAYDYAENKLVNWINGANKCSKTKVQLYGQSLGGSLSLICASSHPDKIGKVFAYNPPAPTDKILRRYKTNSEGIAPPQINVYNQKNDLVSYIGKGWDEDWNVYRVIPKKKNPSLYLAHIQGFTGQENVLVQKIDILKDNSSSKRLKINKLFNAVQTPLFIGKTASLKWSMIKKGHTIPSFLSKITNLGVGRFFRMLYSQPKQNIETPFIQNLLNEVSEWKRDPTLILMGSPPTVRY